MCNILIYIWLSIIWLDGQGVIRIMTIKLMRKIFGKRIYRHISPSAQRIGRYIYFVRVARIEIIHELRSLDFH